MSIHRKKYLEDRLLEVKVKAKIERGIFEGFYEQKFKNIFRIKCFGLVSTKQFIWIFSVNLCCVH